MRHKIVSFISVITILFFTGCGTPEYNLEPMFNKDSSELIIDDLKLEDFKVIKERKTHGTSYGDYKSLDQSSNNCSIRYRKRVTYGNSYFRGVKKEIERGTIYDCNLTELNNLEFLECRNEQINYNSYSIIQEIGMGKKAVVLFLNQECYNDIKDHFETRTKKEKLAIKTKLLGNPEASKHANLYQGSYSAESTGSNDCNYEKGDIYLVQHKNKYYGYYFEKSHRLTKDKRFQIVGVKKNDLLYLEYHIFDRGKMKLGEDSNLIEGTIDGRVCTIKYNMKKVDSLDPKAFKDTLPSFRKYRGFIK